MECKWNRYLSNHNKKDSYITVRQASIAYMDDTTWIAKSKQDMDNILEDAKTFYKANDSQINGEKSILITINNPNTKPAIVQVGPNKERVVELD